MKKYGEIERFNISNLLYIFKVEKWDDHPYVEINISYFDIAISKKSAKKKRTDKNKDLKYSLLNEGFQSFQIMRRIEKAFKDYLSFYKPLYIAISAYKDSNNIFMKRIEFYKKRLNKLGYFYESIDNEYEDSVYYFKLK